MQCKRIDPPESIVKRVRVIFVDDLIEMGVGSSEAIFEFRDWRWSDFCSSGHVYRREIEELFVARVEERDIVGSEGLCQIEGVGI